VTRNVQVNRHLRRIVDYSCIECFPPQGPISSALQNYLNYWGTDLESYSDFTQNAFDRYREALTLYDLAAAGSYLHQTLRFAKRISEGEFRGRNQQFFAPESDKTETTSEESDDDDPATVPLLTPTDTPLNTPPPSPPLRLRKMNRFTGIAIPQYNYTLDPEEWHNAVRAHCALHGLDEAATGEFAALMLPLDMRTLCVAAPGNHDTHVHFVAWLRGQVNGNQAIRDSARRHLHNHRISLRQDLIA
jgi:hypothetical protein